MGLFGATVACVMWRMLLRLTAIPTAEHAYAACHSLEPGYVMLEGLQERDAVDTEGSLLPAGRGGQGRVIVAVAARSPLPGLALSVHGTGGVGVGLPYQLYF